MRPTSPSPSRRRAGGCGRSAAEIRRPPPRDRSSAWCERHDSNIPDRSRVPVVRQSHRAVGVIVPDEPALSLPSSARPVWPLHPRRPIPRVPSLRRAVSARVRGRDRFGVRGALAGAVGQHPPLPAAAADDARVRHRALRRHPLQRRPSAVADGCWPPRRSAAASRAMRRTRATGCSGPWWRCSGQAPCCR